MVFDVGGVFYLVLLVGQVIVLEKCWLMFGSGENQVEVILYVFGGINLNLSYVILDDKQQFVVVVLLCFVLFCEGLELEDKCLCEFVVMFNIECYEDIVKNVIYQYDKFVWVNNV